MNKVKVNPSEPNVYPYGLPMKGFYELLLQVESKVAESVLTQIRSRVVNYDKEV